MKALTYRQKDVWPKLTEKPKPEPGENEVLVRLATAALNHRDVYIVKGLYPNVKKGVILGSDGAGWLDEKRVLIQPGLHWGPDRRVQSDEYQILGMPTDGTFAEYIKLPQEHVFPVPEHLNFEEAAALPLAGLTAYRATIVKGKASEHKNILITGIGGGVAQQAMVFSQAVDAEVYVTSSSDDKIDQAISSGARGGANYHDPDWPDQLKDQAGAFDLVVDGAAGDGFKHYVELAAPAGRIILYGGTAGKIDSINPYKLFWRQVTIMGTTMGAPSDFKDMLSFVKKYKIRPVVDRVYPLEQSEDAFKRMAESQQIGKIVFKIDV